MSGDEGMSSPGPAPERLEKTFSRLFETHLREELIDAAEDGRGYIVLDWRILDRIHPDLVCTLAEHPEEVLQVAREALRISGAELPIDPRGEWPPTIRVTLPERRRIRELRSSDIGHLLAVEGQVLQASGVRPRLVSTCYECSRCGHVFYIDQVNPHKIAEPFECKNEACDRRGPFKRLLNRSRMVDSQIIKIQEYPEGLGSGEQPRSIEVEVLRDLVEVKVTPGDRVIVTGMYSAIEKPGAGGPVLDVYLQAYNLERAESSFEDVEISEEDEARIRALSREPGITEILASSVSSSIKGMQDVKEALMVQLFGSPEVLKRDGTRIRGDIHILIIGDPGIAKSQLISSVARIAPRARYTAGRSASAAGLTASAVKSDSGQWRIEAGVLPLADGGIACIDEFAQLAPQDQSALHEAMEQQSISVSKAGISLQLKSRASVLAACNPKFGRLDTYEPLGNQLEIKPAILSRFDLIFCKQDRPEEVEDRRIAEHILGGSEAQGEILEPELMRKYIAFARLHIFPTLSPEASARITEFYLSIRAHATDAKSPIPITPRSIEALSRMTRAYARARLSSVAELQDAERAVRLLEIALQQTGMDPETGQYDVDIINFGRPKSSADRVKVVLDLVGSMGRSRPVHIDDLIRAAGDHGIPEASLKSLLQDLKTRGEVMEPLRDRWSV